MNSIEATIKNLLPNEEAKITYLLGAGASAFAIPTVNELPNAIFDLCEYIDRLNNYDERFETNIVQAEVHPIELEQVKTFVPRTQPISTEINEITKELRWLHELATMHSSLDTAAKKFYILREDKKLIRLKRATAIFFYYYKT